MKSKKYFILVFGCQMNKSDGEKIETILGQLGYLKTASETAADLIVVVACSIRQSAIDRIYGQTRRWQSRRQAGKLFTILTGCVLDKDRQALGKVFDLVLAIKDIGELPKKLANFQTVDVGEYFHIDPRRNSRFQANVPIMTGCNNYCTFCVVPYTRGHEIYRPAEDIIRECHKLIAEGYKEITLLGQNVNSYHSKHITRNAQREIIEEINFPQLLKMIDEINGDWWLRFVSSNPQDCSPDLLKVMAAGRHLTPYLHFAVQSGDNEILKKMNRRHSVEHYQKIIIQARRLIPDLMVSTDIIVGFPGETKKQFNNTVKLFRQVGYDMAYISKYSVRPQTAAAKLMVDDVSLAEKSRRALALNMVLAKTALVNNKKYLGRRVKVLVEGCANGRCHGKTATYKTVTFSGDKQLVGRFMEVTINRTDSWGLAGELTGNKLVVVLGPTATGKTKLAAKLAAKYNGEIVSADSRQVYRGMDIGSGKDLADYKVGQRKIPYHLINIVSPKTEFNVAKYQKLAYRAIDDVLERGKLPLLVGGTGLYLDAVTRGYILGTQNAKRKTSDVRKKLNRLTLRQLLLKLKKIDPATYQIIDPKNRRRVQRAVEIYYLTGQPKSAQGGQVRPPYEILCLGIKFPLPEIYRRIDSRLESRLRAGMIAEVKKLRRRGVSWRRLDDFGLEYRWVSRYLRGWIDYSEMIARLKKEIHHFAKRQLTWFKRRPDIIWVDNYAAADRRVKRFISRNS